MVAVIYGMAAKDSIGSRKNGLITATLQRKPSRPCELVPARRYELYTCSGGRSSGEDFASCPLTGVVLFSRPSRGKRITAPSNTA